MNEVEFDSRLQALRERKGAMDGAMAKARETVLSCVREVADIRVAAVTDPQANQAKNTESRIKTLERQRAEAQNELDAKLPEYEAIATAIQRLEAEMGPRRHARKIQKQADIRATYRDVAARLLDAVNLVSELSNEAKKIFSEAHREFTREETMDGQPAVIPDAGLAPIWDEQWIQYGQGTRRDAFVSRIFDFDRTLVPATDSVSRQKIHQEEHMRKERDRHEAARKKALAMNSDRALGASFQDNVGTLNETAPSLNRSY